MAIFKNVFYVVFCIIGLSAIACSFESYVYFDLYNESGGKISIEYAPSGGYPYTTSESESTIANNTRLRLYTVYSRGQSEKSLFRSIKELPFDTLVVRNGAGQIIKKDVLDFSNWEKKYDKDQREHVIRIYIEPEDF